MVNMIFICLIIISGIVTTNTLQNSSLDRVIFIPSCQANKSALESIPRPSSDRHYYFYLSTQSSSSLSSSSLPLLHLSYCEHQQTTYYSSSGFSILRSSPPRFLLTDIVNKNYSSSFHHHNAVLSAIDHSSSTSSSIVTLMSSSNENNVLVDTDSNNLISSTIFSNVSLLHTSLATTIQKGNRTFNITLLIGCISIGVIIMIIIYATVKYYNRDEGSYKIDESNNFTTKSYLDKNDNDSCIGKISSSSHHRQKLLITNEQNIRDSKEWYV